MHEKSKLVSTQRNLRKKQFKISSSSHYGCATWALQVRLALELTSRRVIVHLVMGVSGEGRGAPLRSRGRMENHSDRQCVVRRRQVAHKLHLEDNRQKRHVPPTRCAPTMLIQTLALARCARRACRPVLRRHGRVVGAVRGGENEGWDCGRWSGLEVREYKCVNQKENIERKEGKAEGRGWEGD